MLHHITQPSAVSPGRNKRYTHNPYAFMHNKQQKSAHAVVDVVVAHEQPREDMDAAAAAVLGPVYPFAAICCLDDARSACSSSSSSSASVAAFAVSSFYHQETHFNGINGGAADSNDVSNNSSFALPRSPHDPHTTTLHRALIGYVSFVPYPTSLDEANVAGLVSFGAADAADAADYEQAEQERGWERLFIGQVPYKVTEMQLRWFFHTFGAGASIRDCERITKKSKTGGPRLPTGCIHANIHASCVRDVCERMHKRLLVDDSGVWFAASEAEMQVLNEYVAMLKADPRRRFPERPYDTMVVQVAESHFFPAEPRWVSNAPEQEHFLNYSRGFYANENKQSAQQRHPAPLPQQRAGFSYQQQYHYQQQQQHPACF